VEKSIENNLALYQVRRATHHGATQSFSAYRAPPCLFVADNTTIVFNLFCSFFLIIFLHRAHLNEPQFAAQSSPKVETTSQQSFFYITIAHNIKLARQENAAAT